MDQRTSGSLTEALQTTVSQHQRSFRQDIRKTAQSSFESGHWLRFSPFISKMKRLVTFIQRSKQRGRRLPGLHHLQQSNIHAWSVTKLDLPYICLQPFSRNSTQIDFQPIGVKLNQTAAYYFPQTLTDYSITPISFTDPRILVDP